MKSANLELPSIWIIGSSRFAYFYMKEWQAEPPGCRRSRTLASDRPSATPHLIHMAGAGHVTNLGSTNTACAQALELAAATCNFKCYVVSAHGPAIIRAQNSQSDATGKGERRVAATISQTACAGRSASLLASAGAYTLVCRPEYPYPVPERPLFFGLARSP